MATHSSVLAWRIPGMAEPGGLPSMGSHRVGHELKRLSSSSSRFWTLNSWGSHVPSHSLSFITCEMDMLIPTS